MEGLLFVVDIFIMCCLSYWVFQVDRPGLPPTEGGGGLFRCRDKAKGPEKARNFRQRPR